jgi:uncharacterized protein (TIGR00299 family) protein
LHFEVTGRFFTAFLYSSSFRKILIFISDRAKKSQAFMNIAYFDTFAGISGDMTLGAFIHAGVPLSYLQEELKKLRIEGYTLHNHGIERSAISAIKIDVEVEHEHHHEHSHEHHSHRSLTDILSLIKSSKLPARVQNRAEKIFTVIGEAEAKIHNTTIKKIHFHEVGAVDSIVDIVGACICLEYFNIEKLYSSPVRIGNGGFVNTQHGTMPIPTPATVEILKGYPTVLTDIPHELTTPTGAGIIKTLSSGMLSLEQLNMKFIGYGAGTNEISQVPNLLRVFIGELHHAHEYDELVSVETNIDNMNPEVYPFVIEQLLAKGAHDAYLVPVIMKKGRPGIVLSALVNRGNLDAVLNIIFSQTTTLGVRIQHVERRKLQRGSKIITTRFGKVKIKTVITDGTERLVPEFEECRRIALEKNIPLKDVYRQIESEL